MPASLPSCVGQAFRHNNVFGAEPPGSRIAQCVAVPTRIAGVGLRSMRLVEIRRVIVRRRPHEQLEAACADGACVGVVIFVCHFTISG